MASVYKRSSDRKRGKAGRWTITYLDDDGKRRSRVGYTDRAESLRLAQRLETEAGQVRSGLVDPADRLRRAELAKPIGDQIASYVAALADRGDTPKHTGEIRTVLIRLFVSSGVATLADHGRIREVPRGLARIERRNEAADRRVERRALTRAELARLIRAAESGPPFEAFRGPRTGPRRSVPITGPERSAVYRLAVGTGFRAREIRTLTPDAFRLDGPNPSITVRACYAKNGKLAVQPITEELAESLRPFVTMTAQGVAVFPLPVKTAQMLRRDLAAAGIDPTGVDFHALRHTFVSHLIAAGANPKVVQSLARHSTITLTLDRYAHAEDVDLRDALRKVG